MNPALAHRAQSPAEIPGLISHWVGDDTDSKALAHVLLAARPCKAVATAQGHDGCLVGASCDLPDLVSARPPRLCWKLPADAAGLAVFARASHVALNFFPDDGASDDIARRFDSRRTDKFADIAFEFGLGGAPLLERAIATFECESNLQYAATAGANAVDGLLAFVGPVRRYRQPVAAA